MIDRRQFLHSSAAAGAAFLANPRLFAQAATGSPGTIV